MRLALRRARGEETLAAIDDDERACTSCGHAANGDEIFCTACGATLSPLAATGVTTAAHPVPPAAGRPSEVHGQQLTEREPAATGLEVGDQRSRVRPLLVSIVAAIALVGVGAFAWMWHGERTKHHITAAKLQDARVQIRGLQSDKTHLTAELEAAQQLSNKRAALLARSDRVLQGLNPLLSTVDELKSITGDMQSQRDTFASDSDVLVTDLITFDNYLVDNDPAYYDATYLSDLVSQINSEIDTVRSEEGSLSSSDGSYASATDRFDTRATTLTRAVQALKLQLKAVGS
jgi:hypothetical protein